MNERMSNGPELPPRPEPPDPRECCESGCNPCVHDLYYEELELWRRRCEQILAEHERQSRA